MKRNWLITITFVTGKQVQGIRSHSSTFPYQVENIVKEIMAKKSNLPEVANIDVEPTRLRPAGGSEVQSLDWAEY